MREKETTPHCSIATSVVGDPTTAVSRASVGTKFILTTSENTFIGIERRLTIFLIASFPCMPILFAETAFGSRKELKRAFRSWNVKWRRSDQNITMKDTLQKFCNIVSFPSSSYFRLTKDPIRLSSEGSIHVINFLVCRVYVSSLKYPIRWK